MQEPWWVLMIHWCVRSRYHNNTIFLFLFSNLSLWNRFLSIWLEKRNNTYLLLTFLSFSLFPSLPSSLSLIFLYLSSSLSASSLSYFAISLLLFLSPPSHISLSHNLSLSFCSIYRFWNPLRRDRDWPRQAKVHFITNFPPYILIHISHALNFIKLEITFISRCPSLLFILQYTNTIRSITTLYFTIYK